ncbi:hypothetical protein Hdeb2414_s0011g00361641 [Helianthus debilis subsp. tardiflorus]
MAGLREARPAEPVVGHGGAAALAAVEVVFRQWLRGVTPSSDPCSPTRHTHPPPSRTPSPPHPAFRPPERFNRPAAGCVFQKKTPPLLLPFSGKNNNQPLPPFLFVLDLRTTTTTTNRWWCGGDTQQRGIREREAEKRRNRGSKSRTGGRFV